VRINGSGGFDLGSISLSLGAYPLGDADIHIPARKRSWENHVQRYGRVYVIVPWQVFPKKKTIAPFVTSFGICVWNFYWIFPEMFMIPKLQA